MAYQGMFAVIAPALISGALVDRVRFGPYMIFITTWLIFCYAPLGFWNWGGGWMFQIGAWDFAGGMVVHEAAGFSSAAAMWMLGKRASAPPDRPSIADTTPHSLPLVLLGTAMLWFGWFGFNGGSALTIGGLATVAFVNTQLAPSAAMITWQALDWFFLGRPTLFGACSGAVAGLVTITPSAGFVQPQMAMLAGVIGACVCWFAVRFIKRTDILDDAVDTVGVHGVGGFLGTILVGVISDPAECLDKNTAPDWCANPGTCTRSFQQLWIQIVCAVASALWSFAMTALIFKVIQSFCPRLETWEEQEAARDEISFNEVAYKWDNPAPLEDPDLVDSLEIRSDSTGRTSMRDYQQKSWLRLR